MERSGMRNLFAITRNAGRNEIGKTFKQIKVSEAPTGGCRLSEPEAKFNGAKGANKAWAGMECPQRRKQTKIGRMAGHETQWNAQPSANKESF